jgi:hypothetical protein
VSEVNPYPLLQTDKEIVIYRGGWGFSLPRGHQVRVDPAGEYVSIRLPQAGGIYHLERVAEVGDELRVYVGGQIGGSALHDLPMEYPFPTIDVELQRLRVRLEQAAGSAWEEDRTCGAPGPSVRQQFEAWAAGENYDQKTTRMRELARELERASE